MSSAGVVIVDEANRWTVGKSASEFSSSQVTQTVTAFLIWISAKTSAEQRLHHLSYLPSFAIIKVLN